MGYKQLKVWKKADEFAFMTYKATKTFPREEIYGITSQLRRAALSVPTNIVEGMGRQNKKETKQFINIALGSLLESEYLLSFCSRLEYLSQDNYQLIENIRKELGAMLWAFYKSF